MKKTSLTGLVLTLLMLLLVLIAAFIFLFQGRQKMIEQRDGLESKTAVLQQDLDETESDLSAIETTRAETAAALATAETDTLLLDGELVQSQQEVDAVTEQLDAASQTITTLEDEQEAVLTQPPDVAILSPAIGRLLPLSESVNIVLVATDSKGLASVNLLINEETFETYLPGNETLFTAVTPWNPAVVGEYGIQITAVNSQGISSSSSMITVTVAIADTANRVPNDANAELRGDIDGLVSGLRQLPIPQDINQILVSGVLLRQAQQADALALAGSGLWATADLLGQAFDFAPSDYEYEALLLALHNAPTAAYYRPLFDEMLLIEQDNSLIPLVQLGYVRQLLYLIQDQNFGLDELAAGDLSLDASLALAAMREGEATVVQENFLVARYLPLDTAVIPETWGIDSDALSDAPPAIANRLLFPYEAGADFVRTLYSAGDYPALDAAWATPPQSTEQILHPEKFVLDEAPLLVTLPNLLPVLGDDWTLAEENVLGEFLLGQYLAQQLNETQVETAVSGWGGDRFAIYTNESAESFLMVLHTVWDTADDSIEFAALYPNYPTRLYGSSGDLQANGGECWQGEADLICLYQSEQETLIVRGPALELVLALVDAIFPEE
ncbi:hypothetical protein MNBD_CHLOROFLEXI01-1679 [hydrothermal vent metagenome]|uniref:Uncharacterized protein n=1 Tax=hydrothermal vent metagenome TaxID=652676 RepID=A0A3B0VBW9_9ZZZZ